MYHCRRRQIATLKVPVRNRENYYFCTILLVLHRTLSGRISVIFPARMAGINPHYSCIPQIVPLARLPLHIPQMLVCWWHKYPKHPLIEDYYCTTRVFCVSVSYQSLVGVSTIVQYNSGFTLHEYVTMSKCPLQRAFAQSNFINTVSPLTPHPCKT